MEMNDVFPGKWRKLGRLLSPKPEVAWMATFAGPSFAICNHINGVVDIYVTGRNIKNRSQIGVAQFDLNKPHKMLHLSQQPVFIIGELGTFDENGVSYPYIVKHKKRLYLYYVGWMPTVLTPFNLQLGLATKPDDGKPDTPFERWSPAPILPRNAIDHLSVGSCCVRFDEELKIWQMWYTAFVKWGKTAREHKHYYHIKYAQSGDGINWRREGLVCIDFANEGEYAICRPTVIKTPEGYHMWFTHRGQSYRIGYAYSKNGIDWTRRDELAGITVFGWRLGWRKHLLSARF